MELDIRRADIDDAELLSQLSTVTFLDTFKGTCTNEDIDGFVKKYFNIEQVFNELRDPNDVYYISFLKDKAVGYIRMKEENTDVPELKKYRGIELKRIYVLKEYHNKKVGAALIKFALEFAGKNKYNAVWLGVWEHNKRAKDFYQKWGFRDTGIMHDFPIGSTPQTDHWLIKLV